MPTISADGQHIAFESAASNLISGDDNGKTDIFTAQNPFLSESTEPSGLASKLTAQSNNLLSIGDGAATQLKFSVAGRNASEVAEIVAISTDDELGTVDGKAPGDDGYLQAALIRSTVVLSTLEAGEFADFNPERILGVSGGQFIQFAIIQGGSVNDVLRGGSGQVIFATDAANADGKSAVRLSSQGDRDLQVGFRLSSSNRYTDVTLSLTLGNFAQALGSQGQTGQSRIIDLTGSDKAEMTASIEVFREASLNNTVGFYEVEDEQGRVKDPMTGELLSPDDAGYFQAAIAHFADLEVTGQNGRTTRYTHQVSTNKRLSMFLVVDGTIGELVDADTANDPTVYFNHLGANADGKDHVRLLGDNTFGFEDTAGGGDMDFDDVVVKMKFT